MYCVKPKIEEYREWVSLGHYFTTNVMIFNFDVNAGFTGLKNCCGMGGSYNFGSGSCGKPGVFACDDPSQYIGWDGVHLTEAAYRLIADGIINGPCSVPQFSNLCSVNVSYEYGHFNS